MIRAQIVNEKVHWIFDDTVTGVGDVDKNGNRVFPPDMHVVQYQAGWKEGWDYDETTGGATPPTLPVLVKTPLELRVEQLETDLASNRARIEALERGRL